MKFLGQSAVRGDADRFVLGGVVDVFRAFIPIRLAETKPLELAAGSSEALQIIQGSLGITVLPGVDAGFSHLLEQLDDALGSVPGRLMLAEHFVEVRIAVYRVAADDEASDGIGTELDGRQESPSWGFFIPGSGACEHCHSCRHSRGLVQEIAAT